MHLSLCRKKEFSYILLEFTQSVTNHFCHLSWKFRHWKVWVTKKFRHQIRHLYCVTDSFGWRNAKFVTERGLGDKMNLSPNPYISSSILFQILSFLFYFWAKILFATKFNIMGDENCLSLFDSFSNFDTKIIFNSPNAILLVTN
jgi:hypothetical protein